jgi:hypothetical protein
MWWTRQARDQALGVSLWIGILLGVFAVKAKKCSEDWRVRRFWDWTIPSR